MQNIKDPDQKNPNDKIPKNHTLSTIYPPVHTPFIKMFQIFLLKEEKLEYETKMVSCIHWLVSNVKLFSWKQKNYYGWETSGYAIEKLF